VLPPLSASTSICLPSGGLLARDSHDAYRSTEQSCTQLDDLPGSGTQPSHPGLRRLQLVPGALTAHRQQFTTRRHQRHRP
jgi:hypothetical protein